MTSIDKDGFTVHSLGNQSQSARKSAPSYSISRVGRHHREPVYISEEHTRVARIGRESPKNASYNIPTGLNTARTTSFGGGKRPQLHLTRDDPDDIPTNDALGCHIDSQPFKYRRDPHIIIGTEPRGKLKEATLLRNHSAAFFGRDSPGPAAIGDKYGPNYGLTKPGLTRPLSFGQKTTDAATNWTKLGDNPPDVGPGRHDRKDVAIGQQHLSRRRNQSVHEFARGAKFPKDRKNDEISTLDAARSCLGKQVLGKNRSEPSVGFGCDTRDTRSRTKICITKVDEGPRANLPKAHFSMPRLPTENSIMGGGIG